MLILKKIRFLIYFGLVIVFLLMAQIAMSENLESEVEKFGLIDKTCKYVVEPQFDGIANFSEGLALAWLGEKAVYIDKTGKVVIPFQFDGEVSQFSEGLATARLKRNDNSG